jgi:hypothetical protein
VNNPDHETAATSASLHASADAQADTKAQPARKAAWQAPEIIWYAPVSSQTQGISYRPGDGISNLS